MFIGLKAMKAGAFSGVELFLKTLPVIFLFYSSGYIAKTPKISTLQSIIVEDQQHSGTIRR
jgi:hypothetical protein